MERHTTSDFDPLAAMRKGDECKEDTESALCAQFAATHLHDRTPSSGKSKSRAQSCFFEGLQLIYRFCSLRDMTLAARACKEWYEPAKCGKSRFLTIAGPSPRCVNMTKSPLSYLVTRVGDSSVSAKVMWSFDDLVHLRDCASLMSISVTIDGAKCQLELDQRAESIKYHQAKELEMKFPAALKECWIRFKTSGTPRLHAQQMLMQAFASAPNLLSVFISGELHGQLRAHRSRCGFVLTLAL
jgi:hypothetical protein